MKVKIWSTSRRWAVALLAAVISGCGGGGGSGGAGANGGQGVGTATGLVPAAGVPGATLYAQAAPLRPLRAGSKWVYRSRDYTQGTLAVQRETTVRQSAGSGLEVIETDSSDLSTSIRLSVDAATGAVMLSTSLELSNGGTRITVAGAELRSPVRQGEQSVLLDQRVLNSGADVDGDRVNDAADVAIWSVVAGNENISLPGSAVPVAALRVDQFLKVRVIPSGGGAPILVESQGAIWYQPNVGVVRQATMGTGGRALDDEDLLTGYDGVTQGYGYLVQDASGPGRSAGGGSISLAVATPDAVLAYDGRALIRLSRSGALLSRDPSFAPSGVVRAMWRPPVGVRVLSGSFPFYQLHSVLDTGTPATSLPVRVDLSGGRADTIFESEALISGAPGSDRLWLFWQRSTISSLRPEMVLRAIDAQGSPATPETRLASFSLAPTMMRLAARPGGGAMVSWQELDTSARVTTRVAWVNADGSVAVDRTLPWGDSQSGLVGVPVPLSDSTRQWLFWSGADPAGAANMPHAVQLDAFGQPIGVGTDTSSLRAASLVALGSDGAPFDRQLWAVSGGRVFAQMQAFGPIDAGTTLSSNWVRVVELNIEAGGFPAGTLLASEWRIPLPTTLQGPEPLVFDDRLLLFTDDGDASRPTVVWRR
ncbi:conserved exported hypothetical protein [Rubrivivax sp. A210]|uniref:hypothetical protein n=1 Tax=Rubrivivax sp. A210 TaxID=2772301 RepID=UPI00191939BF|nr:hypothetical protein [Rubrivivax sp. A210]CAD5366809.1 conserved exported hypothetical protein [Rubrivivax sp. A210]